MAAGKGGRRLIVLGLRLSSEGGEKGCHGVSEEIKRGDDAGRLIEYLLRVPVMPLAAAVKHGNHGFPRAMSKFLPSFPGTSRLIAVPKP
jgi:hypothetical protein